MSGAGIRRVAEKETPIPNPGKPAIDAALNPAPEKYRYFVLQGDGSHRFSRTLGEHLDAVWNYRGLKK